MKKWMHLVGAMEGKPGDLLLFAADKNKVVYDVLGRPPCRTCKTDGSA